MTPALSGSLDTYVPPLSDTPRPSAPASLPHRTDHPTRPPHLASIGPTQVEEQRDRLFSPLLDVQLIRAAMPAVDGALAAVEARAAELEALLAASLAEAADAARSHHEQRRKWIARLESAAARGGGLAPTASDDLDGSAASASLVGVSGNGGGSLGTLDTCASAPVGPGGGGGRGAGAACVGSGPPEGRAAAEGEGELQAPGLAQAQGAGGGARVLSKALSGR